MSGSSIEGMGGRPMGLVMRAQLFFAVFTLVSAPSVRAEIYQCDGKWTNKPCAGAIERTIHESAGVVADTGGEQVAPASEEAIKPESEVLEPLAPRYALARKVKKVSKEFAQKHNISLSKEEIRAFEERCTKRETPFSQCQSEHDAFVQRLTAQAQAQQKK